MSPGSEFRDVAEQEFVALANSDPGRVLELAGPIGTENETLTPSRCRALAIAHRVLGQLDEALAATTEGVRRAEAAGDGRGKALCQLSGAPSLAQVGRMTEALDGLNDAEHHLLGIDLAELRFQRAGIFGLVADYRLAAAEYGKALQTFRRKGVVIWQADALMNRGLMLAYLGDTARARRDLSAAAKLFADSDDQIGVGAALHNRALASLMGGTPLHALEEFERAGSLLDAAGFPVDLFAADHCEALLAVGLRAEALELGIKGVRALEAAGNTLEAATQRLIVSRALRQSGDYSSAREHAEVARRAFAAQGQPHRVHVANLTIQYADLQSGRDPAVVRARARDIGQYFTTEVKMPEWRGHALLLEARAAIACGDLGDAQALLVVHRRRPSFAQDVQRLTLAAELAEAQRQPGKTLRAARRALRRVEVARDRASTAELHDALSHHLVDLREIGLAQLLGAGRGRAAFSFAERLARVRTELPGSAPAPSLVEHHSFSRAIAEAENEHRDPTQLRRRQYELERRIRAERSAESQGRRPDAEQDWSPSGEAIVCRLVVNRGHVWSLDAVRNRVSLRRLGSVSEVDSTVRELLFHLRRAFTAGPSDASIDELADRLDVALGRPGSVGEETSVLNLVPDRALRTIPFGLLPSMTARPWALSLCGTRGPSVAPLRRHDRVVLVAGPELQSAEPEVRWLQNRYEDAHMLVGAAATIGAVRAACDGAGIVHIAAHGEVNPDNPMFSSIRLADGDVTIHTFDSLLRPPRRMVLATCSSASSSPVGLASVGLSTSLLRARVDGVIGTACEIPDLAATTAVVDRVHGFGLSDHVMAVRDARVDVSLGDHERLIAGALVPSTLHPIGRPVRAGATR